LALGGSGGGKRRDKPMLTFIDVVTRKKISNKKEISAIELELISLIFRFGLVFNIFETPI
jgi:hypothetical protein